MAQVAIDFLLGTDWPSRLIAWFGVGAGGYSHCASVLKDGRYLDARDNWIGNVPPGVHIRDPKSERWLRKCRATLEVTDAEYADWEANLRAKMGTSYGWTDIAGFVVGHDEHIAGDWICSALAINAVQHIKKLPYPLPIAAHQISPDGALIAVASAGFTIGAVEKAT